MNLAVQKGQYYVVQIPISASLPPWVLQSFQSSAEFFSVTKTTDEISIVVEQATYQPIENAKIEKTFIGLKIEGTLDFSLVGILSAISTVLADAGISIFAVSTYNTDFILVKSDKLVKAVEALKSKGYNVKE